MGDDMDWDEIWDGLDNEKNWDAEKYRAQTTLLAIEDLHKHWDRCKGLDHVLKFRVDWHLFLGFRIVPATEYPRP